ncbi:YadA-like family protein, partial [Sneathia sanguinegens]
NAKEKDLDNITEKGKEEIKKLVNVSKVDDNDNILEITGGTEAKGQAKDYKLSVKKSTIEGIAKEEAKKFVSDSVKVSSTDGAITVAADKTTDANVINYKLTLNKEKIKELSGTTNLATEYAKVDGTNLTNLDDTNKKAWATGIGTSSIDATTKDELVTDKAVKEYLTTEIGKVNNNIENKTIAYKANNDDQTKKETTLTTGFDFTSDDLEIKTEDNGKVTFNLTDKVKNSLNGKGNDGRDGKDGTNGAGSKGLTGKDGLNGKDLTTKVNALRNGEVGTVVYTDKDGNRLVKANDGNYYKAEYVEDNGALKVGHSYADGVKDISATLVNPDGSTTTPTTKLRVADGSIAKDSKDAINGGQLNNLGYMLGLEVNGKNTGFKAPKIEDLKGTNTTPANVLDGLNQTREQMNKGLTFEANYNADPYGTSNINKMLGGTLSITASGAENGKYAGNDNSNYTGTNLATYVKTDTEGKKKFYIGMKETPTFNSINIGSSSFGNNQKDLGPANISADDNGLKLEHNKASITISKADDKTENKAKISGLKDFDVNDKYYGKENSGIAATQKEVKDVLNKINANGTEQAKLKNGTLGTLVYTDKDGNKLMKDTDGKFYKAQADGTKEENAKEVASEDVILSTVKPDGKTTEPITLGNVASALGLSKDKKDKNNEILNKLVNKKAEASMNYTEIELNKVVTLRDLQFLAKQGITFAGSVGTANKYLGDTITINGSNSKDLTKDNFATKYETKNIAVKVDNNTGNIEVGLAKELSKINSITSEEDTNNKTKTKITLSKDGATFGVEKDVINGNNTTTQQVGVKTTIGKDGISVTKQGGQNPSVSIKAGDTTNGPSIDFATTSADNKTVGTGSITGLKDLDDNSDGHMAANKNYVDEKVKTITGDIEKLKNKGLKFAGNTGETNELNDKVNIKGEGTEANNFESAKGNINVVAKESNVELQLSANLKNMKSFEAKDDKGNTVNITGDKIEFKKNNKSTLTINSDGTITGLKTNSSPFEYYEKNKDTVFAKDGTEYKAGTIVTEDGKVYAKGTQEVEGKYFAEGDKVVKAKDGKFYKEKDIKDRTYDEATKKWSGDSAQPTEATEAKALEGNDLKNSKAEDKVVVKGKDNKFYEASDFEKAEYDEAKNEYTKDGKKLEGKEAKDVVIKALPNNEAMTLSNIANARLVKDSKDAVNAGQMLEELDKKMNKDGSNIDKKEFANNISEGANITKPEGILVTDKQVNEHLSKNYYNKTEVDAKVSNISNTVVEANKKSDLALGGVANAVAMANLLQANSYSKYKTNISAAYGYYGGANALAVGFSGVSENRMVSYRVSGSVNTKGNIALGAGLGVMLGEFKTDKYPEKGKKISELEEKLRLQTEKTNKLEKQLEEIMKLLKK